MNAGYASTYQPGMYQTGSGTLQRTRNRSGRLRSTESDYGTYRQADNSSGAYRQPSDNSSELYRPADNSSVTYRARAERNSTIFADQTSGTYQTNGTYPQRENGTYPVTETYGAVEAETGVFPDTAANISTGTYDYNEQPTGTYPYSEQENRFNTYGSRATIKRYTIIISHEDTKRPFYVQNQNPCIYFKTLLG